MSNKEMTGAALFPAALPPKTDLGYLVVTPLKLADSNDTVLVKRGWILSSARHTTKCPVLLFFLVLLLDSALQRGEVSLDVIAVPFENVSLPL